jgi:hypothetical protein
MSKLGKKSASFQYLGRKQSRWLRKPVFDIPPICFMDNEGQEDAAKDRW